MVNLKQVTIALLGTAFLTLLAKIITPKSEILNPANIPDFWSKVVKTEKDSHDLTINIHYTNTFIKTMDGLDNNNREEIKNKINDVAKDSLSPYTKLYNHGVQTIPKPKKSKVAKILTRMHTDPYHEEKLPTKPVYRKLKHTRNFKMAYWVHPNQPKEILTKKINKKEPVELDLYIIGYGNHVYVDGQHTKG